MAYQSIEVRKLTPSIGAEIFGVDLGKPLRRWYSPAIRPSISLNRSATSSSRRCTTR